MASQELSPTSDTRFGAYLFTHGAWFVAFGVQTVLFSYLVRVVLHESAVRFGLAQMCLQLPTTLLILFGGVLADRTDTKPIVTIGCGLAAMVFLGLGVLVVGGKLSYELLIIYALLVGTIGAFVQPARDSLLSLVAPPTGLNPIQNAVAFASLAQFGGQILGMICATAAPLVGVGPLLLGQAALMVAASAMASLLRPRPRTVRPKMESGNLIAGIFREIAGGLSAVFASPVMTAVTICAVAMGVCFMGSFFVLLPMIVQDYFPASVSRTDPTRIASALGLFSLCFWSGSMISALVLMRLGSRVRRKGVAYLSALTTGGIVLLLCGLHVPFWIFCGLNFIWGLGGGVAMTLGRGLMQQHAPEALRARILAVFTLGTMGGGPLGAVADGALAQAFGPHVAVLIPGALMLILVTWVATQTHLIRDTEAPAIA